jgi:EAL and modified HD-GYP domain-containing signal transduction protein
MRQTTLTDQTGLGHVFVARQPILDRNRKVVGYSLRLRPVIGALGPGQAGQLLAETLHGGGLETLTAGRRAFVEVDRGTLLEGVAASLPPDRVVVELTSDVEADAEVLEACRVLRRTGHAIAIDDFTLNERTAKLVPFANYLKVDASAPTAPEVRARIVACLAPGGASLVAKNIETLDKFDEALRDRFTYFQGFFFGRPLLAPRPGSANGQIAHLKLLRALQDPDLSVRQLEELVKHDTALCYRILRTVNSAAFMLQTTVHSVLEALVLLGINPIRRWASLWVIAGLSETAHSELVLMSAVRARCCEILAGTLGGEDAGSEAFLLGMCSMLDAILGRSMSEVLIDLPLDKDTQAALRGQDNWKRRVLDCVIAYERGDWDRAIDLARRTAIERTLLPVAYAEALKWSRELSEA